MYLVVGLGNPGREHEGQRHNVGFEVVDALRRAEGWPDYKPKFSGLWTRGRLADEDVVLLQPQTFMNLSGESVQPAAAFLKVEPPRIVVVHDELDLAWRDVRLKAGGGHAGHNGVRSIIQLLGTPEFARVRVGIGRPPAGFRGEISDWVLSRFDASERAELPGVIATAVEGVRHVVGGGSAAIARPPRTKK
ncbi:MAG: aminoacyl-tRNA hydrolase [Myxococcota bacterium]|nr:aminoacyl-tRNA hydrolase [Myxococcota bacterium]